MAVGRGVEVEVDVGEAVGGGVGVAVAVGSGVRVGVAVGRAVLVAVGVAVGRRVGVALGVEVGVAVQAWLRLPSTRAIARGAVAVMGSVGWAGRVSETLSGVTVATGRVRVE